MKLALIGIDYKTAEIETREKFSLTDSKIKLLLVWVKSLPHIKGAAFISTCNRTELYLSIYNDIDIDESELINIFSEALGLSQKDIRNHIYIKTQEKVIVYLFELASGIHSMIFGDDQIASQVGDAIKLANEVQASDSILNTLFRHAVTCSKKVKTSTCLKAVAPSVATEAVELVKDYIRLRKCKALVIGNGEIGRIMCKKLVAIGCEVYMTLRTYKYKPNIVPEGCKTTEYENRTELYSKVDILISATRSPHYTVSYEVIKECCRKPKYILDLALPRDIDPKVRTIKDVIYYDIDAVGKGARCDSTQEIGIIREIVAGQLKKYKQWLFYHKINQGQVRKECMQ